MYVCLQHDLRTKEPRLKNICNKEVHTLCGSEEEISLWQYKYRIRPNKHSVLKKIGQWKNVKESALIGVHQIVFL